MSKQVHPEPRHICHECHSYEPVTEREPCGQGTESAVKITVFPFGYCTFKASNHCLHLINEQHTACEHISKICRKCGGIVILSCPDKHTCAEDTPTQGEGG